MLLSVRWFHTAGLGLFALALSVTAVPAQPEKPKKVALVVGVNKYKHAAMNKLSFAEADATDLAKELKGGGYDDVVVLNGPNATRENIFKKLDELRKLPGDGGVLLVALAGHGLQPGESTEAYFCPYDADQRVVPKNDPNPGDPWDYKTMVPLSDVLARLKASGASTRVLLMDACRNDPSPSRGVGTGLNKVDLPDNTAVLLSCSRGQRSFEHKSFGTGHGAFFHHVLLGMREKGLDKKGRVTADSLWEYVRDAVPDTVSTALAGVEQKPFRVVTGDVDLQLTPRAAPTALAKPKSIEGSVKELEVSGLKRLDSTKGEVSVEEAKKIQTAWADALGLKLPVQVNVGGNTMEFVLVPPGSFMMGSQRRVIIERPFLMGACEVRQSEYVAVASSNPSKFQKMGAVEQITELVNVNSTDDFPVESVKWQNAQDFATKLLPACKAKVPFAKAVRLPSEAEWEFAGRAGATTPFQNNEKQLKEAAANFDKRLKRTAMCGQLAANPLGLKDMHGNVAEWCQDGYVKVLGAFEVIDPIEEPKAEFVVRGGSWQDGANECALGSRSPYRPDYSARSIGFRVVVVLDVKK